MVKKKQKQKWTIVDRDGNEQPTAYKIDIFHIPLKLYNNIKMYFSCLAVAGSFWWMLLLPVYPTIHVICDVKSPVYIVLSDVKF